MASFTFMVVKAYCDSELEEAHTLSFVDVKYTKLGKVWLIPVLWEAEAKDHKMSLAWAS